MFDEIKNRKEIIKSNIFRTFTSKPKQDFTSHIIFNGNSQILFLRRSPNDQFCPDQWCLPGGKIDSGENALNAVKRETQEECSLDEDDYKIVNYELIQNSDANLHYFVSFLVQRSDPFVCLDEQEHCNYEWCDKNEWMKKDLMLDLKEHLIKLLHPQFV